jgi:hypothetical protein
MTNQSILPVQSLKTLFMATAWAIVLALIILIIAVLPAEYGIDPTGLGKAMGLTQLAPRSTPIRSVNSKPSVAADISIKVIDSKRVDMEMASLKQTVVSPWKDTVTLVIPPMKGLEYKFYLEKGATLTYKWQTDGATLYFDFHGEPKGDTTGYFKSFNIATDHQSNGTLTTVFAGAHGWYWKNKTQAPIEVQLKTTGDYQILGKM